MSVLFKNCTILAMENDEFKVYKNACLGVDGDTIDYIGNEKPETVYGEEKDMTNKLLMPGLINCHGHTAMTLIRGLGSDLSLQEWLFDNMFPIEDRMSPEDIHAGMELAYLEMISTGTTSYTDMYMEPAYGAELAGRCGLKCNVARIMQSFNPTETYEENGRGVEARALYDQYNETFDGRVKIDYSIHAEYTCNEQNVRAYSKDAKDLGTRIHIHMSETKKEHDDCVAKYGKTPAQWFNDLGTFDTPCYAAHCVWITDDDMKIMKEKGVTVIHNPTSNMKLGSGFCPVPKLLDLGVNVALGTDGAASNNNLNMFEEMHVASIIHNGHTGDPTIAKASDVIRMATINGAKAQGRADTGSLEVGKKADIIALDLTKPHLFPDLDTLALVAYSAQGSDVCMTMVDGKVLYENGSFLTIDKAEVYRHVEEALRHLYPERF